MTTAWEILFWTSLFLVAHTYLLYPAILFVAYGMAQLRRDCRYLARGADRRCHELRDDELPAVSLIIPAHNEEAALPAKLVNLIELDYPADRLEVIFVSDGSADRTNEILKQAERPALRLVELPRRGGKSSALNHGVVEEHAPAAQSQPRKRLRAQAARFHFTSWRPERNRTKPTRKARLMASRK